MTVPYRDTHGWQRADELGHVSLVNSPIVNEKLGLYRPLEPDTLSFDVEPYLTDPTTLGQSYEIARHAVAIDSSRAEPALDERYPSRRALYVQLGGVLVDLGELNARTGPFRDPARIEDATTHNVAGGLLPSAHLLARSGEAPVDFFRRELHDFFARTEINGRSLLTLLAALLRYDPKAATEIDGERTRVPMCPRCKKRDIYTEPAGGICTGCGATVYPTDRLRLHEIFDPYGSNAELAGRLLTISEHLAMAGMLLWLHEKVPVALGRIAFIFDGPLGLFGEVAALHNPLLALWQDVAARQRAAGHGLPTLVGVEKNGRFAEHAEQIADRLPPGMLMTLTREYIHNYVSPEVGSYSETYYGRKFLYRTRDGRVHVLTVPPLGAAAAKPYVKSDQPDRLSLEHYPTLRASCDLLDRIGTMLHPNALAPVALAHRYVSIPFYAEDRILRILTDETIGRISTPPTPRRVRVRPAA